MRLLETERERYADDGRPPLEWERYLEAAPFDQSAGAGPVVLQGDS